MTGRRLPDDYIGQPLPGDYWRDVNGHWYAKTPNGRICGFSAHVVIEHGDGTISVSPTLLVYPRAHPVPTFPSLPGWRGVLERGVWSES